MITRLSWLSVLLAGCAAAAGASDAGSFPCPPDPPVTGSPCDAPAASCVYERCATEGVIAARCEAEDAGAGSWSISTTPCDETCGGRICAADTVCAARIGGALLRDCHARGCGDGPLGCECACGAGQRCEIYGSPSEGAVFACYVDCGADICP